MLQSGTILLAIATIAKASALSRRGPDPLLEVDPGTVAGCSWWYDNKDGSIECWVLPAMMEVPMETFLGWNPGLTEDCGNFQIGHSYCIEVSEATTTVPGTPTPTDEPEDNALATPSPILPGIADNCWRFHKVKASDTCADIAETYSLTQAQFYRINPYVGNDCNYLPEGTNVCVGTFDKIPSVKHHGCYAEAFVGNAAFKENKTRALDHSVARGPTMTLEWCAIWCLKEQKQDLFGVENGKECWCGNSLNIGSTKAPAKGCSSPCAGNENQTCGGTNRLNVYGAAGSPAPVAYRPFGCYTEGTGTRALGIDSLWAGDMTIEKCADYCLGDKGTAHFNVQNSIECWCGNNLGLGAVMAPGAQCSGKCAGDKKQKCGSDNGRLNLFSSSFKRPPMKYTELGCHTELANGHALPDATISRKKTMTVDLCAKFCIDEGYPTFGLQGGKSCWCGNKLKPASNKAPETKCNKKCTGKSSQMCGGSKHLNVYEWDA